MILLDEDLEFYSLNNILDHQLGAARPLLTVIELEWSCIFHGIPRSALADCYSPRPTGGVLVKLEQAYEAMFSLIIDQNVPWRGGA